MKKFKYKMENILNIKYKLEEQSKVVYGEAKRKLEIEINKLQTLEQKKESYCNQLKDMMCSRLNVIEIKQCENAVETIKYHIKIQNFEVKRAEQNLENARIKMNQEMVERKTHEKLKEVALLEYLREQSSEEMKEIDELVSFKYNNNKSSEDE